MNRKLDKEKFDKMVEYINETLSIKDVLDSYSLFSGESVQGNNVFIKCPFHTDHSPSFSINLSRGLYKCFSCNRGGNAMRLKVDLMRQSGRSVTMESFAEETLRNDSRAQLRLGFNSIYQTSRELTGIVKNKVNLEKTRPETILTLVERVSRDSNLNNLDTIKKVISMVEEGVRPSEIYDIITRQSRVIFDSSSMENIEFDFQEFLKEGGD